jgi:multidrug efflux pump subunit AcrA (membrane-fusion protein)
MFSVQWVAAGDNKSGPYLCRKVVRFQVTEHLRGGELAWDPTEQGYLVVFEMMNRHRALLLFKEEAQRQLEKAKKELDDARTQLSQQEFALIGLQQESEQSDALLQSARTNRQPTAALLKTARAAERLLKEGQKAAARTLATVEKLIEKTDQASRKIDDPAKSLQGTISARILGLLEKQAATTDEVEAGALLRKVLVEQQSLSDPVKSLLARYRMLNVNGLIKLKVSGVTYLITTPPVPALPTSASVPATTD